jgi:hypothetical protein
VEGLDPAYTLQEALEYDCEPTVWPQGIFNPTRATLADLLQVARNTDFAAFIFTPDDVRTMRREDGRVPRDNVVFELGLMIGAIGPERCFFVAPGDERLQLPSDLIGLTPLTYVSKRRDENLLAALGPAANKIRRTIRECGPHRARDLAGPDAPSVEPRSETAEFARLWKGGDLLAVREILRGPIPFHASEDETGEATAALRKAFTFMESLADGVLAGRLDEKMARAEFAAPLHAIWQRAHTYLAPLNGADEWNPIPCIAVIDQKWQGRPE